LSEATGGGGPSETKTNGEPRIVTWGAKFEARRMCAPSQRAVACQRAEYKVVRTRDLPH